jgi:hypothetical protein
LGHSRKSFDQRHSVLLLGPDDVSARHAALLLDLKGFSSQCQTCCNYAMQENLEDKNELKEIGENGP